VNSVPYDETLERVVEDCFAGRTLQQPLELINFAFTVDGVSRACTHQLVRTRLGAGYMQHGGRDNDWRHRSFRMPETIRRVINEVDQTPDRETDVTRKLVHCLRNREALEDLEEFGPNLRSTLTNYLRMGKRIYAALVDAGVPWQDARRFLWMGTETYLHVNYNYLALQGFLANRLEFVMDWEINCVAQLMLRAVRMACPPLMSQYLGSHSDRAQRAMFDGLGSWPPDGKWPSEYEKCAICGRSVRHHFDYGDHELAILDAKSRTHRRDQMPFWVLSPASMKGEPIEWIPTNGRYPYPRTGGL